MYAFCLVGGEDFAAFRRIFIVPIGIRRRCVAITILEDSRIENDESFELAVEELGVSTNITILDDEGLAHLNLARWFQPFTFIFTWVGVW